MKKLLEKIKRFFRELAQTAEAILDEEQWG